MESMRRDSFEREQLERLHRPFRGYVSGDDEKINYNFTAEQNAQEGMITLNDSNIINDSNLFETRLGEPESGEIGWFKQNLTADLGNSNNNNIEISIEQRCPTPLYPIDSIYRGTQTNDERTDFASSCSRADEEFSYHTAFSPYHQSVDTEVTGGEGSNTKREAKESAISSKLNLHNQITSFYDHRPFIPEDYSAPVNNEGQRHRRSDSSMNSEKLFLSSYGNKSGPIIDPSQMPLPYPRGLRVAVRLSHTLIIEWIPPDDHAIINYHVIVNGSLKTIVDGNKYKAVVEEIFNDQKIYVISVCCVTSEGRSDPGHCLMTYTRRHELPPILNLHIEHVTTNSARVAWQPHNSDVTHEVRIADEEDFEQKKSPSYRVVAMVPPPFFKHTIQGLEPGTAYEVVISSQEADDDPSLSSNVVRFETPGFSPPDAPKNVQMIISQECVKILWSLPYSKENPKHQSYGCELYLNGSLFSSLSHTDCELRVPFRKFARKVAQVLKSDLSYSHATCNFPHVFLTIRLISSDHRCSDASQPLYISYTETGKLLEADKLSDLDSSSESNTDSQTSIFPKARDNKSVPIIEITDDKGSERWDYVNKSPKTENKFMQQERNNFSRDSQSLRHTDQRALFGARNVLMHFDDDFSSDDASTGTSGSQKHSSRRCRCSSYSASHLPRSLLSGQSHQTFHRKSDETSQQLQREPIGERRDNHHEMLTFMVALFDYDPRFMSPNTDSFDEELPFREGEIIQIFQEKDMDGFYYGGNRFGHCGYVPSNMVAPLQRSRYYEAEESFAKGNILFTQHSFPLDAKQFDNAAMDGEKLSWASSLSEQHSLVHQYNNHSSRQNMQHAHIGTTQFQALCDYNPNSDLELKFSRGDIINVVGDVDDDGYFKGELHGRFGLVPSNFVQRLTDTHSSTSYATAPSKIPIKTTPEPVLVSTQPNTTTPSFISTQSREMSFLPPQASKSVFHSSNNSQLFVDGSDGVVEKKGKFGFITKGRNFLKRLSVNVKSKR